MTNHIPDGFDYKAFHDSLPERLRITPQERQKRRRDAVAFNAKVRNLYRSAMGRAASQNVPFTITQEWLRDGLLNVHECAVTGIPFVYTKSYQFLRSLDRIKPELGYTPENCRWVIYAYNSAKGTGTDEDVMRMAEALVARKPKPNGNNGS